MSMLMLAARPPLTVTVDGVQLTDRDVAILSVMVIYGTGAMQHPLSKAPSEMPPGSPYIYYAGKDDKGAPIVWISDSTKEKLPGAAGELQREQEAVAIVTMLDAPPATTGPQRPLPAIDALHPLYAAAAGDPQKLNRLGLALADAIRQMSDLTVARSADDRRWMFATLTPAMNRAQVYAALRGRGLRATAQNGRVDFPADGPAIVTLDGAFEPGCSFSNTVTIAFDATNHVEKLDYGAPIPDCL